MARHSGKNGIIKNGANVIGSVRSFDFEETAETVDTTAMGDDWATHIVTQKSWSGSISVLTDNDNAAHQTMRAGDAFNFEGYSEGDANGKTYYSGLATVTDVGVSVSHDSEVETSYSITGNGPLDKGVVGA